MDRLKVTWDQYANFVKQYDVRPDKQWYRFGQAFYNEFATSHNFTEPDPTLFYQRDRKLAAELIIDKYVTQQGLLDEHPTT